MPENMDILIPILILIVGFLYSSVGHAGASGYLAVMALTGVSAAVMKPTALTLNILVAVIGSVQFWRAGHFEWRLFWPFALGSIPLAWVGGRVQLPPAYYKTAIGLILLFSAWRLLVIAARKTEAPVKPPSTGLSIGIGAALGLVSGLTGTGGGIFLSPLMILCNWADPKRVSAVAVVFILVNSASGLAGYWSEKGPPPIPAWSWLAAAAVGGVCGSYLGARRFNTRTLRRMLAVVLVIAGGKLVWEGGSLLRARWTAPPSRVAEVSPRSPTSSAPVAQTPAR